MNPLNFSIVPKSSQSYRHQWPEEKEKRKNLPINTGKVVNSSRFYSLQESAPDECTWFSFEPAYSTSYFSINLSATYSPSYTARLRLSFQHVRSSLCISYAISSSRWSEASVRNERNWSMEDFPITVAPLSEEY